MISCICLQFDSLKQWFYRKIAQHRPCSDNSIENCVELRNMNNGIVDSSCNLSIALLDADEQTPNSNQRLVIDQPIMLTIQNTHRQMQCVGDDNNYNFDLSGEQLNRQPVDVQLHVPVTTTKSIVRSKIQLIGLICYECQKVIQGQSISLQCGHAFHSECLGLKQCKCRTLNEVDLYEEAKKYSEQLEGIYKKQQIPMIRCKNGICEYFYVVDTNMDRYYCPQCNRYMSV